MSAYTSSDEFDLERRVWMTNELPPYDMYNSLHSTMHNSFWKWVIGTVNVGYDYPYLVYDGTAGGYVHNEDSDDVYLKMTNGQVSSNYGPQTDDSTYNRLEIDGILEPEFDLFLHEIYRYTETLYPDHPDERFLLTENEFNDTILAAADMIDYTPDVKFFDKVASSLSYDMTASEILDEAAKLKIHNLLNESFRRKLYGSKAGYRMFANDIFQLCTIFPVATYLPLKEISKDRIELEQKTESNLKALNALNMNKDEYIKYTREHNRVIDTYSSLYNRKFRLVDWNGENSSYLQKDDENTYFYGFSIPCEENRIFEYPSGSTSTGCEVESVTIGSFVENSNDPKGITYINSVNYSNYITEVSLANNKDGSYYGIESTSSVNRVAYIETSHLNWIPYITMYLYDNVAEYFKLFSTRDNLNYLIRAYNNKYVENATLNGNNYFDLIFIYLRLYEPAALNKISLNTIKVLLNPYADDTLLLEPSISLSFYPNDIIIENEGADFKVGQDEIIDKYSLFDKEICNNDLTIQGKLANTVYYISNFTKGKVTYNSSTIGSSFTKRPTYYNDGRYAIIIETKNGDRVALFGKVKPKYSSTGTKEYISGATFDITAIPEYKSEAIMRAAYTDVNNLYTEIENNKYYEKPYLQDGVGMSYEGCEDIISLYTSDTIKYEIERIYIDTVKETAYQAIQRYIKEIAPTLKVHSKVEIVCDNKVYFFYKASLPEENNSDNYIIPLGSNNVTDIDTAISLYKNYSGKDYSKFIVYYITRKADEEKIANYSVNKSHLFETAKKDEDGSEYERSTIQPGCNVIYILYAYYMDGKILYARDLNFGAGLVDTYSLGCLNVFPLINNRVEVEMPYKYNTVTDTYNFDNDNYCKTYTAKFGKSKVNLYYLEGKWYNHKLNNHITRSDQFSGLDYIYLIDNNSLAYSSITGSYNTNSIEQDSQDWFASYNGTVDNSTNITCKPIETYTLKIEGVVDIETEGLERTITFTSDVAKERFRSLSVGDTVFGPTLDTDDNNIYIESIGDNYITVNHDLQQSGTFIFTFNCKLHIIADDISDNVLNYRDTLDESGLYSITNPFDHGLYGSSDFPHASNAILESLPDILFYKPYNYITPSNLSSFNEVMEKIHPLYNEESNYRLPSTIKFNNDLFVELNLNRYTSQATRTSVTPSLITVDWLDYLSSRLNVISRATDKVNIGANLMMETDSTGYYTLNTELTYTDPNIRLKFITMNFENMGMWNNEPIDSDNEWTVPAYAQIGSGGSGRSSWFTSPADITYPTIWGNAIYDSSSITSEDIEDLELNNGRLKRRSVWGRDSYENIEYTNDSRYQSVEKPLFEIPLGEYDIQTRYLPNESSDISRATTTVQSSFFQETFNNLTKYMMSDDLSGQPIIVNNNNFITTAPLDKISGFTSITYLGEWVPEKYLDENNLYQINYPIGKNNGDYYIINTNTTLSDIGENLETIKFTDHTLMLYNNGWKIYTFKSGNLFGTLNSDGSDVSSKTTNTDNVVISYGNTRRDNKYLTFKESLLLRILNNNNATDTFTLNVETNFIKNFMLESSSINLSNTIIWFINLNNDLYNEDLSITYTLNGKKVIVPSTDFTDMTISKGDVFGLLIPSTYNTIKNSDGSNSYTFGNEIHLVKLNRCYFTNTLSITRYTSTSDTELKYLYSGTYSTIKNLTEGMTEITLPRKFITEGSYNFNYIIDPQFLATGYLYTSSSSNSRGLDGYDQIPNDNFDTIDKSTEVKFNITRGAIYKDDTNNEYYVFTDKIYDENGEELNDSDTLKKVAIKFAEQKYFKNTLYITGVYQVEQDMQSGSDSIGKTATISAISGITEFQASYLSAGDRILKITPMSLRSIYSKYLESTFFSNYKNYDAEILGIDKNDNLVLTYDHGENKSYNKTNFTLNLKQYAPANKYLDEEAGKYVIEAYDDTYYDFTNNDKFLAPTVKFNKVTKSMISDNTVDSNSIEFKYFKNLILARVSVSLRNPNIIYQADNDSGQFQSIIKYIRAGDTVNSGITIRGTADKENLSKIELVKTNGSLATVSFVAYDEESKKFMAINNSGIGYFAENVNLSSVSSVTVTEIPLDGLNLGTTNKVDGLSFDKSDSENPIWIIRVTNDDETQSIAYSIPFYYALNKNGHIDVIGLFGTEQRLNGISISNNTVVETDSYNALTYNSTTESMDHNTRHLYVLAKDYAIAEATSDSNGNITYKNKPYITTDLSKLDEIPQTIYAKDTKSDYAVFICGRDLFIRSPNYYCDASGNYTDEVSSNFYWKKTTAPVTRDGLQSFISSKITSGGESSGYDYVYTRWQGFNNNWDFLFAIDLTTNDISSKITNPDGCFTLEPKLSGTNVSEGTYVAWRDEIKSILGVNITASYIKQLQTVIKRAKKIVPVSWTKIKSTIINCKKSQGTKYYVFADNTSGKVVENSITSNLKFSDGTAIDDYLVIWYDGTKYNIEHYGIGKLASTSYINMNEEEIEVPLYYNVDATMSKTTPTATWSITTANDSTWYSEYLYLLDSYVYLDADFENLFRDKVYKVLFTDDSIVFICNDWTIITINKSDTYKTEDINDIDNWKVATVSEYYSYTVPDFGGTKVPIYKTIRTYIDSKLVDLSVKLISINEHPKIFDIKSAYCDSKIMLLGGYLKSISTITQEYSTAYGSELQDNAGYQNKLKDNSYYTYFNNAVYPFILYSTNNGASFSIATVDETLPNCSLQADGTNTIADSAGNSRRKYIEPANGTGAMVNGIHYIDGKYKLHLSDGNGNEFGYQLYPEENSTNGELNWASLKYEAVDETETEVTSSYEEFYSNFELFIYSTSTYVNRASYIGLTLSDNTVSKCSDSSITLAKPLATKQLSGGTIQALVTFYTRAQVPISAQIEGINKFNLSEYMDGDEFKLDIVKEVDNYSQADRMYNYRETLTNSEKSEITAGYRAINEDTDHTYYKYSTSSDADGNLTYVIKDLQNAGKLNINLCDIDGNLIYNSGDSLYTYSNNDILLTTFDPTLLPVAGQTTYPSVSSAENDPSLRLEDTDFTKFDKTTLTEMNFTNNSLDYYDLFGLNGKSYIESGDYIISTDVSSSSESDTTFQELEIVSSVDTKKYSNSNITINNLKELPSFNSGTYIKYIGDKTILADPFVKVQLVSKNSYIDYLYSETDKDDLIYDSQNNDGAVFDTINMTPYNTFDSRFELLKIGNKKYYYDKKLGVYPFKKKRYINIDIYTDYALESEQAIYTNRGFNEVTDESAFRSPITGIYIPQKGYGGLRNRTEANNSWSDELPWDLDPKAFENSYLLNSAGDYIKLCNNSGIAIDSNNGETECTKSKSYEIYYDDILPGKSKEIKVYQFNNNSENDITSIFIYRPVQATAQIWSSTDSVYINFDADIGTEQKLANVKFVIPSQFRFENASFKIESSIDNSVYQEDENFKYTNGILIYDTPDEVIDRPKYVKLTYSENSITVTKIISIISDNIGNVIYNTINPIWYYKSSDNLKTILKQVTIGLSDTSITSFSNYSVYSNGQFIFSKNRKEETYTSNVSITDANGNDYNLYLPIFDIGVTKTYAFADYDNNKYIFKSFIDDFNVTNNVKSTVSGNKYIFTYTNSSNNISFVIDTLTLNSLVKPSIYLSISSGSTFVPIKNKLYATNNDKVIITTKGTFANVSTSLPAFIKGTISPILLRKPAYNNFNTLLNALGYIVSEYGPYFDYNNGDSTDITFKEIETNKVTLTNPLGIEDIDDGNTHYIRVELLTQYSIPTNRATCNNPDYYIGLDNSELDKFPPDRVYFEENGYPKSPILIDNTIYRSENNVYYTKSSFTNTNGSYIRECNSDGELIRYYVSGGTLASRTLTATDDLDTTFIPLRPNYMTCKEWFAGKFYIKGQESNPFWQVINLKPSFNSISQEWSQVVGLKKYSKVGTTIKMVDVDDGNKYVTIYKGSLASYIDDTIIQNYNTDYLDLSNGVLRFIFTQPDSMYKSTENLMEYGIYVTNSFYNNNFNSAQILPGYLQSSYTVNSRKNFANPADSDSSIVEVTEFGLFNKAHQLIAYAVFPPIEYRTDSQHVSFTSFIKYGSCNIE